MGHEVLITLTRPNVDVAFPEQDDQERERLAHFKQTGDLLDFYITQSEDGLTMVVHYVFDDNQLGKVVTRDPVILAIREEWQAICYENHITYSLSSTKNDPQ